MVAAQAGDIGSMRFDRPKIPDLAGQCITFGQVPRRMLVAAGFCYTQGEVDHRPQGQRGSQGIVRRQGFGGCPLQTVG